MPLNKYKNIVTKVNKHLILIFKATATYTETYEASEKYENSTKC